MPLARIAQALLHNPIPENERVSRYSNSAVIGWFLRNFECFSLHLEYASYMSHLTCKRLSGISRQYMPYTIIPIRKLVLKINAYDDFLYLKTVFSFFRDLFILEMHIKQWLPESIVHWMPDYLSWCSQLTNLKITGVKQRSIFFSLTMLALQSLKQVEIACKELERDALDYLPIYKKLTKLHIHGDPQTSRIVLACLKHMPNMMWFNISCNKMEDSVASSFQACPRLKILMLTGTLQSDSFVQNLLTSVPSLSQLHIACEQLSLNTALCFKEHADCIVAILDGEAQTNIATEKILSYIPRVQMLSVGVDTLDFKLANTLRMCQYLVNLQIKGQYVPDFLSYLVEYPIPKALKYIKIYIDSEKDTLSLYDSIKVSCAKRLGLSIVIKTCMDSLKSVSSGTLNSPDKTIRSAVLELTMGSLST
ncbi:hypothetical protein NECID01_1422 [Nematocida sp. AWRm77]|nr:hypothetical protein NECID01_1422 [Nematocida sp. AWRm77]